MTTSQIIHDRADEILRTCRSQIDQIEQLVRPMPPEPAPPGTEEHTARVLKLASHHLCAALVAYHAEPWAALLEELSRELGNLAPPLADTAACRVIDLARRHAATAQERAHHALALEVGAPLRGVEALMRQDGNRRMAETLTEVLGTGG